MTKYKIIKKIRLIPDTDSYVIAYKCPNCGMKWETAWLWPEAPMIFTTNCCDAEVLFE